MQTNIEHELIRVNAAYFRKNRDEIAAIIKRVLSLPEDEADCFMGSETVQALIMYAFKSYDSDMHDEVLILFLLALDPAKPYTKKILDAIASVPYFNPDELSCPSDDLLENTCDLTYLDGILNHFDEHQFNAEQEIEITIPANSPKSPQDILECSVHSKLRKRIIEASVLNHYFYTAMMMSVFNFHRFTYLKQNEEKLAADLVLLINKESNWPLVENILLSDEKNQAFLLAEFLAEAIANKNVDACNFLLDLELKESLESDVIDSFRKQCKELNFHEGEHLLRAHFTFEASRTMTYRFWAEKKRRIDVDDVLLSAHSPHN